MKFVIVFITVAILSNACLADCMPQANAAVRFMNEYKQYADDVMHNKTKEVAGRWIQRNTKITRSFKNSYKKIVRDAQKAEPEMGLGFDPVFDAQDYPDRGFKMLTCDERTNLVTLQGIGEENFRLVVKTVKTDKGSLVDGAGVVNIPKLQRARRD